MNEVVVANAVTVDQTAKLGELFWKVINFIINLFFSIVDTIVTLVTQPAVLSGIAFIAVVTIIYGYYKKRRIG